MIRDANKWSNMYIHISAVITVTDVSNNKFYGRDGKNFEYIVGNIQFRPICYIRGLR